MEGTGCSSGEWGSPAAQLSEEHKKNIGNGRGTEGKGEGKIQGEVNAEARAEACIDHCIPSAGFQPLACELARPQWPSRPATTLSQGTRGGREKGAFGSRNADACTGGGKGEERDTR